VRSGGRILVDQLERMARSANLPEQELHMLMVSLRAAQARLDDGDYRPATKQLGAFINKVEALVRSERLGPETAQGLIAFAERVIARIN